MYAHPRTNGTAWEDSRPPATTYEKPRRSDAVPDNLAPASSLSMSDSQDAEYGETTTWAR